MIGELTTHLWQSTLFAIAAGFLTLAFRRNRAKVRFWLWLSASLKFFIPFALLMNLGSRIEWAPAAQKIATQIATPAVSFAAEFVAQPFAVTSVPAASRDIDWMPVLLLGMWACGLLVIAFIRLRLWLRIRVAVRDSTPLEIPAAVGVRSAPGLLEPGVVGLLKPVLLLPEGITDLLTPSQLEAVLAHELCHIRRRDNLFASIHMVVEAVFWFYPLVWWIGARLVEERERACDEDVLSLGSQPRVYADAILSVCKLYVESPLVCVSGVTGSDIKRRIEAIMTNRSGQVLNRGKKMLLAGAGFAALAIPVMIGVVIGVGHMPVVVRAQAPAVAQPALQMNQSLIPAETAQLGGRGQGLPPAKSPAPSASPMQSQDRRLIALLFDFGGMTSEEQARALGAGITYVREQLNPADLVCIMQANTGIEVRQDFTADPAVLTAAIKAMSAAAVSAAGSEDGRLANIETAAKMLAGFPEKKALVYFSAGLLPSGADNQAALKSAIDAAVKARVSLFPIDARTVGGAAGSGGRGGPGIPAVAGLNQDDSNRRMAEAQQKFPGAANSAKARTYARYGAPDQIDNSATNAQIWRYNYLPAFHSSTEFEFVQGRSAMGPERMKINYPPALEYAGTPAADTTLAEALDRDNQRQGQAPMAMNVSAGLPIRHTGIGVYPLGETTTLSVPLDSLSGLVDILAQVKLRPVGGTEAKVAANLRDSITLNGTSQSGMYNADFMLQAGSYVCRVLVREASTGHMFTEVINFEIK